MLGLFFDVLSGCSSSSLSSSLFVSCCSSSHSLSKYFTVCTSSLCARSLPRDLTLLFRCVRVRFGVDGRSDFELCGLMIEFLRDAVVSVCAFARVGVLMGG